jgi:hypothetical protein
MTFLQALTALGASFSMMALNGLFILNGPNQLVPKLLQQSVHTSGAIRICFQAPCPVL